MSPGIDQQCLPRRLDRIVVREGLDDSRVVLDFVSEIGEGFFVNVFTTGQHPHCTRQHRLHRANVMLKYPPGISGSASFRVAALPWLDNRPGYEDWCLLDGSWALDPLNAFAVAGPVTSAHDAAADQMETGHGGLYALIWGEPVLPERSTAVWLTRPRGIQWRPALDTLRQQLPQTTLWRRQMVLGPGKEFALIVPPGINVAAPQVGPRWPSSGCASMYPDFPGGASASCGSSIAAQAKP